MRPGRRVVAGAFFLLFAAGVRASPAKEAPILLGPIRIQIDKDGKPLEKTIPFACPASGAVSLEVVNGAPGNKDRLKKLSATLNGTEIVPDGAVSLDTPRRTFQAIPAKKNTLTIRAAGAAGAYALLIVRGPPPLLAGEGGGGGLGPRGGPQYDVQIVAGDNQTGPAASTLPAPLRARLLQAGTQVPVPDQVMMFTVTGGSGALDGSARTLGVVTNAQGEAEVAWTLGVAAGQDAVAAYEPGFQANGAVFHATVTPGPAALFYAVGGNHQRWLVNEPLPAPLKVRVVDSHGNPVPGTAVQFRVKAGGGLLFPPPPAGEGGGGGVETLVVPADADGVASVSLTLGPEAGLRRARVEAWVEGLVGPVAQFAADACLPGDPARTTFSGVVMDYNRKPIVGAIARHAGGTAQAVTGPDGRFRLAGLPPGPQSIEIDGTGVQGPDGPFDRLTFGSIPMVPGNDNAIGGPFWLGTIDTANEVDVPDGQPVVVTTPKIPGLSLEVAAGAANFPPNVPHKLSITRVPVNRISVPFLHGYFSNLIFITYRRGVTFDPPAKMTAPNLDGLAPGQKVPIWSFIQGGGFGPVGTATVTEDGLWVVSDPDSGITSTGCKITAPPILCPPTTGSAAVMDAMGCAVGGASVLVNNESFLTEIDGKAVFTTDACSFPNAEAMGALGGKTTVTADPEQCSNPGAEPVYLHSGEFFYDMSYLEIPGRGLSYSFKLRYESGTDYNGPVGHGWMHNYDKKVSMDTNGDILRQDGLGRVDRYVKQGASYVSPSGFFDQLKKDAATGDYVIRDPDGTRTFFSGITGKILKVADRNGNEMTFRYDTQNVLTGVLDPFGREVVYDYYPETGRLRTVTDFYGRVVTLEYDGNGDLRKVTGPAVTGTPNGNDFPNGKSCHFTYSSGNPDPKLNHNLLTVRRPNEGVAGPASLTMVYNAADQVESQTWGGTNGSGVPAGGTFTFAYTDLADPPPGDFNTPANFTTLTDPNGNIEEHYHNVLGNLVRLKEFTNRDIRPDDPDFYETVMEYNAEGLRTRIVHPEGNVTEFVYDTANPLIFQRGNLLEVRKTPGPRGGDQAQIVAKTLYEPVYNQTYKLIDPRGNDPSYVPPNGGAWSSARYTTTNLFDYQEASNLNFLAAELGIPSSQLSAIFSSLGITLNQGDKNGDGITTQKTGNVIRTTFPTVNVAPGSNIALIEGDTTQEILKDFRYNDRGQLLKVIDPEGNVTVNSYYPENDPDGDGVAVPDNPSVLPRGYLNQVIFDAETHPRRRETAALTTIKNDFTYDPVGNVTSRLDGRGVKTVFSVNQLDQVVEIARAASIADVPGRLGGEGGTAEDLTGQDYAYKVRVFYDANDNVVERRIENRDGNTVETGTATGWIEHTFTYDILDNLVEEKKEVGGIANEFITTQYRYDPNQNQTVVLFPEGNVATRGYDERDLLAVETRGDNDQDPFNAAPLPGSTRLFAYDKNKNQSRLTDAEDNNGDLQPEQTLTFYDGYDRVKEVRDAVGGQALYTYDPSSNVTFLERKGRNGGPSPTTNDPSQNVSLAQSRWKHDEMSRAYQADRALFATPGVTYNHPPELQEGPLTPGDGFITTITEHDRNSRPMFVIEDDNALTKAEYDGVSRIVKRIDALNNEVLSGYDDNHNLVRITEIEKSPESYVPAETFVTVNRYDSLNRMARTVDTIGQTDRFAYDSRDNMVATSDAQASLGSETETTTQLVTLNVPGNTSRHFFDGINRLLKTEKDLRIDGQGQNGIDTSNPSNPDGLVTLIQTWDQNSRLKTQLDDKSNTTTYGYDILNRLQTETYADTTVKTYGYDRDDNLTTLTDQNGSVRTVAYDGVNRRVRCDVARGAGVVGTTLQTWEYDGLNRNTLCTDNNDPADGTDDSTVVRKYDSLSRMLEEVQNGKTIASDWYADIRRVGLHYPNTREVNFTHDALDRIKEITNNPASISAGLIGALPAGYIAQYDYIGSPPPLAGEGQGGGGRVLERRYGNNTRLTYRDNAGTAQIGYDATRRTVNKRHLDATNTVLSAFEYGYDREDNKTFEKRPHAPQATKAGDNVKYDSLYRSVLFQRDLPAADVGNPAATTWQEKRDYQIDGVQNWASLTVTPHGGGGQVFTQTINNMNEYDAFGATPRIQDPNGNTVDDNTNLLAYDFLNRLVKVTRKSDGLVIGAYTYDCMTRRVKRTVTNSADLNETVSYFYDGWRVIEERNESDVVTKQYVDGLEIDEHLAYSRNVDLNVSLEETFFHEEDAKGWSAALVDVNAVVVERYTYDIYGKTRFEDANSAPVAEQRKSSFGNPYTYSGRRLDPETGDYEFRFRTCDPNVGRFIQRDPIGIWEDSPNLGNGYSYVANRSAFFSDPFGLEILVQWHEVAGSGNFHAFITIIPDNQAKYAHDPRFNNIDAKGRRYATLGAGPERGRLVSNINRRSDIEPHQGGHVVTIPKSCKGEDGFIDRLFRADANYKDDLDYALFPSKPNDRRWYAPDDGYNSNSYVAGLLAATGGTVDRPSVNVPGWDLPVPGPKLKWR